MSATSTLAPAGDISAPERTAKVLIVDDSAVARAVIGRIIDGSGRFAVAGSVSDVRTALRFLGTTAIDHILLDIALPDIDGVTALPALLAASAGAKVLIVSSIAADGAAQTVQALAAGAADTMVKPATGALSARFGAELLDKLDRLGETPVDAPPARTLTAPPDAADSYDIVAIGASTGGIHALSGLLRELAGGFTLPVLVTQHLPTTFMPYFAAQLALLAGRPCDVASDRMRIRPGRLIVAPGDAHLCVAPLADGTACVRLSHTPVANGCMPSVDPMFSSVAAAFGRRAMGVVLSGMGRDGAEGARSLRAAGSAVVVQDRDSSVVWGMPGAVAEAGGADAMLTPDQIGRLLAERRRP